MAHKPIAHLGRDGHVLHLTFLHLSDHQQQALQRVLMYNGPDEVYHLRSEAGAHLDQWDRKRGLASIHLHRENPSGFLSELERLLGVHIPREVNPEYRRLD